MTSAAPAVKAALVTVCQQLFPTVPSVDSLVPPTCVAYGPPGTYVPAEIVSVGSVKVQNERPTASTRRPYEEVMRVEVQFSVFVGAGDAAQQTATERVYVLLSILQDWFRVKPNETLGGVCREAWIDSHELDESEVFDQFDAVAGRNSDITAVIIARNRMI